MKKIVLILLFIVSFLGADYIYTDKNICITSYFYRNGKLFYFRSQDGVRVRVNNPPQAEFLPGYEFINNRCQLPTFFQSTGIDYKDYQFLIGLLASLVGFSFIFFSILIFIGV